MPSGESSRDTARKKGKTPPQRGADYPVPNASARAWNGIRQQKNVILNPGLIFDRFAPDWSGQATLKKAGLEAVRAAAEKTDSALLRAWNARWEAMVRMANAEPFSLKTEWRFIAGLGRKGSLEVGFTFHRYGFPILPGSSVKGLARAWALIEIAQKVHPPSLKDLDDVLSADGEGESEERKKYEAWRNAQPGEVREQADAFRTIFGTTARAGQAIFFDAIPASQPELELDVINTHFPQYYSGDQPPTDWQSPVPVYFLTVAPNTEFRFAVGWRGTLTDDRQRLRDLANQWLQRGLKELGAGAKTSAGYGYFRPLQPARGISPQSVTVSATDQPASPSPTPAPSETLALSEEITWRTGTVREYRPDKGRGRLVDDETGEEFPFTRELIEPKGWSPGKKHKVQYALIQREGRRVVVKVRRRG